MQTITRAELIAAVDEAAAPLPLTPGELARLREVAATTEEFGWNTATPDRPGCPAAQAGIWPEGSPFEASAGHRFTSSFDRLLLRAGRYDHTEPVKVVG